VGKAHKRRLTVKEVVACYFKDVHKTLAETIINTSQQHLAQQTRKSETPRQTSP